MSRKGRKYFIHGNCSSLIIVNNGDYSGLDLSLTLIEKHDQKLIDCRFFGVVGLEIGDLDLYRNMSIEIRDITSEGLDGIHYCVAEVVSEALLFRCDYLEIQEKELTDQ